MLEGRFLIGLGRREVEGDEEDGSSEIGGGDDGDDDSGGDEEEEETAEQILFMLFGPRIWEHNGQ